MRSRALRAALGIACCLAAIAPQCRADLLSAIKSGNLQEVHDYVTQNPTLLNAKVLGGSTPLEVAIDSKNPRVAILLIERGADMRMPMRDGSTSLHHAAYLNEDMLVEYLIERGMPVDAQWGSQTPLSLAADEGSEQAAAVLIAHGADVNTAAGDPMEGAIAHNHPGMARLLLAHGARCDRTRTDGMTYLQIRPGYAEMGDKPGSPDFVDMFIGCGLDVNARDRIYGNTPLHFYLTFKGNALPLVRRLVARGADVNARNKAGQTPLMRAAMSGALNPDTLRFLLDRGADINARGKDGMTLLHYLARAVTIDYTEVARLAIARGADINAKYRIGGSTDPAAGNTPLHAAAMSGQTGIGALLVAKGASVNEPGATHETPLTLALDNNHTDFARMLISHGARVNPGDRAPEVPLNIAIRHDNADAVRLLLNHGADIRIAAASGGMSSLLLAARRGNLDITRMLIEHGANVNARAPDGMTALHYAARDGRQDLALLLLQHGADVNARDANGETPLRVAAEPVAKILLARGARQLRTPNPGQGDALCREIASRASEGTLDGLFKTEDMNEPDPYPDHRFEDRGVGRGESPDGFRQAEFGGTRYLLAMAGEGPLYLARVGEGNSTETLCHFGHRGGSANYYVQRPAEEAVSRYLLGNNNFDLDLQEPPVHLPAELPRWLAAGAEIHVVSGYGVGAMAPGGGAARKVVNVTIRRPGKKVLLVLNSFQQVEWHVTATAGTRLEGILFASTRGNPRNKADAAVVATARAYRVRLPDALFEMESPEFAGLLRELNEWCGARRVDSFFGRYDLPSQVDVSTATPDDKRLSVDYPPVQPAPVNMRFQLYDETLAPQKWSSSGPVGGSDANTRFLTTGRFALAPDGAALYLVSNDRFMEINLKTGTTSHFALPSGFPPLSVTSDVAYDTRRGIVAVATYGGEGFLYRFDVKSHRWLDYHSFQNIDVMTLAYDRLADCYLGWTTDGALLTMKPTGEMGALKPVAKQLPGFSRFYRNMAEYAHIMQIRAHGKDIALAGMRQGKVAAMWYYDLDTGSAVLTYRAR